MLKTKLLKQSKTFENILKIALSVLLISVSSQISIPSPFGVPMTLQTLSIALCASCLSTKNSLIAIFSYIMLGILSAPVFAGYKFGLPVLFGLTGGFIIGFIFLTYFCNLAVKTKHIIFKILLSIIGLSICHLLGILQYSFLSNTTFMKSFTLVSMPFITKDFISIISALFFSKLITKKDRA